MLAGLDSEARKLGLQALGLKALADVTPSLRNGTEWGLNRKAVQVAGYPRHTGRLAVVAGAVLVGCRDLTA